SEEEELLPFELNAIVKDNNKSDKFNDFDIQISITPTTANWEFELSYNSDILNNNVVRSISNYFNVILSYLSLADKKTALLDDIPSTYNPDYLLALGSGLNYTVPFEFAHQAFEQTALNEPDRLAIEHENMSLTYGELNQKSQNLCQKLIKRGVSVGDYVGIYTVRSIEMVVAMFAVLKAGAAFMIIDAGLPSSRKMYMLEVSKCKTVLVHPEVEFDSKITMDAIDFIPISLTERFDDTFIGKVDGTSGNNPSYVIFTSGSTGKPKGVVASHSSLSNFIYSPVVCKPFKKGYKVAQSASIGFDMCIMEMFFALSNSCSLILRSEKNYYAALSKADAIAITPTGLDTMNPEDFKNIKVILVGGEYCSQKIADKWSSQTKLFNMYGPSEVTVASSGTQLFKGDEVSIGYPLPNTVQYIVDKNLKLVPHGVAGELLIGGSGVALGYLNMPDLTKEKFIPDFFAKDGSRLYKTGDICRWGDNGEIQYLGRNDDMVKVKGYRIELNEVSGVVSNFVDVENCVVQVKDGNLVAYITPKDVNIELIREFVSSSLAHYMCPAAYVTLDVFPTTAN
ncbi:hypothetical protein HK099_002596, partial [Clydaea vesicula]